MEQIFKTGERYEQRVFAYTQNLEDRICKLEAAEEQRAKEQASDKEKSAGENGGEKPSDEKAGEKPSEINIIIFDITSEPIADFFTNKLDIKVSRTHVMRIGTPFQPLLRNLEILRGQSRRVQEPEVPLPFADERVETDKFDTQEALHHFSLLLQFVDKYFAGQIQLFERLRRGQEAKVAFENLWMLFDTGDTVYCPSNYGGFSTGEEGECTARKTLAAPKNKDIAEPDKIPNNQSRPDKTEGPVTRKARYHFTSLQVACFHLDFDGVKFGTVRKNFVFKPFDRLVDVTSLEAYPTQYLGNNAGNRYVDRGRKFIDVMTISHMSYEGLTIGKGREEASIFLEFAWRLISSNFVVDFKLAFQEYGDAFAGGESIMPKMTSVTDGWPSASDLEIHQLHGSRCNNPCCTIRDCSLDFYADYYMIQAQKLSAWIKGLLEWYESLRDTNMLKESMGEHDLLRLLPGAVPGFALRNRKWIRLDLELLRKVGHQDHWNQLVLPKGHKEMVQAMVEAHARGSQESTWAEASHEGNVAMDLVQGKGKGCIILLHGVPGVGKTSTAECVASYTQRPLYPITCSDIGYIPEQVERNMEEHFKLAHKLGCVLLLDEADVFLAKRTKEDIKRNGLVSIFLKILEYYFGILFLTTNRVGAIDDAFRSRLHLTLFYPPLGKKQTNKIWKNNLMRLKAINSARKEKDEPIFQFDQKSETSETRTPPPAIVIHVKQFETIANASMQFNEYLQETHGLTKEAAAHRDQIRTPKTKFTKFQAQQKPTKESDSSSDSSDTDSSSGDEDSDSEDDSDEEKDDEGSSSDSDEETSKKKAKAKGKKSSTSKGSKSEKGSDKSKKKDKKKK
ncbi:hypothetical protein QBC38DRAFT_505454 [Podospora fimiseda]|uniref:AAA+ ATPase domain-containing protein n=1 Tax=Podospora fimiseda TaxID=252190 RepID=A0AAN6YR02_9PEZI|nr:hypothetical protein QBC38DRAFT_505454 [Podospora fimiseda]